MPGSNDLDLPFEEGAAGPLADDHVHLSGGLVVMAATTPIPEAGVLPTLVFRFSSPVGEFYPPFVLVLDDDQMGKLRPLIMEAIAAARRAAKAGVKP